VPNNAIWLQHDHIPSLRTDLVDGLLFFDVPLQRATTDKMSIRLNASTTSSVGQAFHHQREIIRRRVAVTDKEYLQRVRAFFRYAE
jgi:hypothetical protein